MSDHYSKEVVKKSAQGRIIEILEQVAGISHEFLLGNHPVEGEYHNGPCPKCGGTDRFRLINSTAGAVFCNQCLSTGNGDFLGAVRWMKDCSFPEAVDLVGKYLDSIGVLTSKFPNTSNHSDTSDFSNTSDTSEWRWRDIYGEKQPYVTAVYHYPDRAGNPSYKIERYNKPDGGKMFCQWRWDPPGRKWVKGLNGIKVVPHPYNLKSLLKDTVKRVFIVEGEKCVDALSQALEGTEYQHQVAVTTVAGGCHQWRYLGEILEPYRPDCSVYFFVDNDEPGEKAVQAGFESLRNADATHGTHRTESKTFNEVFQKDLSFGRPNTAYYRVDFPTPVDPERDPRGYDVADFLEDLTRQGCPKEELFPKLALYIKENKKRITDVPVRPDNPSRNDSSLNDPPLNDPSSPTGKRKRIIDVSIMSDIEQENIQWLWKNKIALGMLTLLAGRGGEGKSYFSAYLASQISRGGVWPDGSPVEKGCTVFLGPGEDPLPQIVRPRLETLDADLSLICEFRGVFLEDDDPNNTRFSPVSLKTVHHMEDVVHYMEHKTGFPVRLLVIDPISSFLEGTQENSNAEIRELLKPLACFAKEKNIAVLLISHFRKSFSERGCSIERVIGSAAFTTSVRAAWFLYADKKDRAVKVVVPAKGNILIDPTGLELRIQEDGRLEFIDPFLRKTAEDIDAELATFQRQQELEAAQAAKGEAEKEKTGRPPAIRDAAGEWLISFLQSYPGGREVHEIMNESKAAGFSFRTIQRAANKLNIVRKKQLTDWIWILSPDQPEE